VNVVFLLDVDNTLLDNDAVADDLRQHLTEAFGEEREERYWQFFEELRSELGYADYLGALQRFRLAYPRETHLLEISSFLIHYPFEKRVFPRALDAVARLREYGTAAILSDGDVVFQPLKIERSGIQEAVNGEVLIYVHKEQELDDVEARYPADRYVLVDDKLRILHAVKQSWGEKVITVFPRQGHYALDPEQIAQYPAADFTLEAIGELCELDLEKLTA
jgi:FMN phosphatase YigB (HAD superfamily)